MKNKRIYLLTIGWIALLAIGFTVVYPEVPVTSVMTVVGLLGLALGIGSNYLLKRLRKKEGDHDEKHPA